MLTKNNCFIPTIEDNRDSLLIRKPNDKEISVMKLKSIALTICFFALTLVSNAWADLDPMTQMRSIVEQLQKTVGDLQTTAANQAQEIRQLKSRKPEVQMVSSGAETAVPAAMTDKDFEAMLSTATGGANKWLKDLSFKGDLRLRYEAFEQSSGHPSETDDRNRFRYRLRYGFEKKFSDEMKIGFAMASGEQSGGTQVDPTSTNTTFDNLFNFKDVFIEKAYAMYTPKFAKVGPIKTLTITAGKVDNPFEKGSSDIIWDRDVKPEGIYEKVDINLYDTPDVGITAYLTAGQFVLDEDGTIGGDAELYAQQAGINAVFPTPFFERAVNFHSAGSWYSYHDYEDFSNFLIGGTSLARGNVNIDGNAAQLDAKDFEVIELFNELTFYPAGATPVNVFFDIVGNPADRSVAASIDGENLAWASGIKVGRVKKKGDWELSYVYKRIEANSVVGAFTDSDFGATGHADKRGSVIKAGYGVTDNLQLGLAAIFVNNLNTGTVSGLRDEEQKRFQMDAIWKF